MAIIKITAVVEAAGNTPYTLAELAEVISYVSTPLRDLKGAFIDLDFKVVSADKMTVVFEGEGSFL